MPVCACLDVSSMAGRCLTLSPVFLVDSKSGGPSQGGLIIVQWPIMTMTCNLSLDVQSVSLPSGISLLNCRAHVNIIAHAHLVVCVGFFCLAFLATFGRHW